MDALLGSVGLLYTISPFRFFRSVDCFFGLADSKTGRVGRQTEQGISGGRELPRRHPPLSPPVARSMSPSVGDFWNALVCCLLEETNGRANARAVRSVEAGWRPATCRVSTVTLASRRRVVSRPGALSDRTSTVETRHEKKKNAEDPDRPCRRLPGWAFLGHLDETPTGSRRLSDGR